MEIKKATEVAGSTLEACHKDTSNITLSSNPKKLLSANEDKVNHWRQFDFDLSENHVLPYFIEHERIVLRNNSGYYKTRLLQLALIFKREIVEFIQNQERLYRRIEDYKKAEKMQRDFIYYLCNSYGLNYQLEMTCFLTNEGAKKTLQKYGATENPKTEAA